MTLAAPAPTIDDGITLRNLLPFAASAIEQAEKVMRRIAPAARLSLHGVDVSLYSQDPGYVALASERLWQNGNETGRREACRILVTSTGVDGLMTPPQWGPEEFHSRRFEKALEGSPFRAEFDHDRKSWHIFDLSRNIGLLWMQSAQAFAPWEPGSPLRVFLHWFYSARGMRLTHAGTLGRNGKGALLIGRGGSGKSGTVVDGMMHGLQSVGDDYVLLEPTDGFPTARPVFRTLKQNADGLRRLGLLETIGVGRKENWQGKYEFFSEDLGVRMTPSLSIRALLVPHVAGTQHTGVTSISQAKAMLALAPSGLFQMPGERDSGVARFAALVRSLPCFGLALGSQSGDASRVIGDFLDALP
ncbi:phosphoenolpyruvate carboxykinase (ATP) [Mesorhizobium neociceri]|uniref:Serine kinase n=1 Tax=Mesorhizobium neociceri TaxID=1307853 RepID=A0A838B7A7_9HYPH|nr:serine kinase [Mesorhizobium neociceri]MBA1142506.1 serine kinase [Mesorhizobium neociceri]